MRGVKYISFYSLNGKEFIFNLNRYLIEDTSNAMNVLHTQIALFNKISLQNKASFVCHELINLKYNFKYIQW